MHASYFWVADKKDFFLGGVTSRGEDERGGDSHLNHLRAAGENYVVLQVSPPTSHRFVIPLGPPVHNHCTTAE